MGNMFGVKTLSLAGSVHVRFTSLHVQAVMPVTWTKRSGIFPYVWRSILPVTGLLTFSNIYKILNIVDTPCVQQIVFVFWITPQKMISLILKLSRFPLLCCYF